MGAKLTRRAGVHSPRGRVDLTNQQEVERTYRKAQRVGLLAGGAIFALMLALPGPEALPEDGWLTAAVAVLMAVWWMTEAIPIPATALLPLVLFPLLGVLEMSDAATPYAQDLIFLFMGGFLLAVTMERWGLHRRIALTVMTSVGTSPSRLVLGFMLATAFLSMWISNTATAALMLPIALAVGDRFRPEQTEGSYPFGVALMLGIAYAASIGGVGTLIGTPPNAVFAAAADEILGVEIGFLQWAMVGMPLVAVMLPLAWLLLVKVLYVPTVGDVDAGAVIREERTRLGAPDRGEWIVGIVFTLTAAAWILRAPKTFGAVSIPGIQSFAPGVRDSTIAMAAALALFLIPVNWRKGIFALDWPTARRIPWGVLVLFGGGLSLARAMERSGLASWIGGAVGGLETVPVIVLLAVVAALFVFLTEITSNMATATMAMPVMAGVAAGLGMEPLHLMATAVLGSSMAFMLPAATPPNAIVFGSNYLTIPQMSRAGIWLNLIAIAVITTAATFLIPVVLGG
ncbi:MAG: DASS family sodium-coupled anion symporter [Gemmatimonadota bacterium]|nr:MAG: DASS family sodium-coupled anion symporter [Gemmatimonadota bacterium]